MKRFRLNYVVLAALVCSAVSITPRSSTRRMDEDDYKANGVIGIDDGNNSADGGGGVATQTADNQVQQTADTVAQVGDGQIQQSANPLPQVDDNGDTAIVKLGATVDDAAPAATAQQSGLTDKASCVHSSYSHLVRGWANGMGVDDISITLPTFLLEKIPKQIHIKDTFGNHSRYSVLENHSSSCLLPSSAMSF